MKSTTEITSASITSDNPIHQRLLFAYEKGQEYVSGNLLEIGCGQGRGLELMLEKCTSYTAIDKNDYVIEELNKKYENLTLINQNIPPFTGLADNTYDSVVTFQVIEHIEDDKLFVSEIKRVLKPGAVAVITTPNIKMSLTRNPWHVREYTNEQLCDLLKKQFEQVEMWGVYGKEKVSQYYQKNKESVERITRLDILNLQYRLPRSVLRIPYDILNRINRDKLKQSNDTLVMEITTHDYFLNTADDSCYDFFCVVRK